MRIKELISIVVIIGIFSSCASSYVPINPAFVNYRSSTKSEGIELDYQYHLLQKKYGKKEAKKEVKLVAVKIINNSEEDITFGEDFILTDEVGNELILYDQDYIYSNLKQSSGLYIIYLPLMFVGYNPPDENGEYKAENNIPFGLVLGPMLLGVNMLISSSSNKQFKNELIANNMKGLTIKKGEVQTGLIGIMSTEFFKTIKVELK